MRELSQRFPVWFVDIWGVIHNGVTPFTETVSTLAAHRKAGGTVILVSNSPRSQNGVIRQLDEIGVRRDSYDRVVTSGDVTQSLMRAEPSGKLYHLGPARDMSLFEDIPVQRVPLEDAGAVICTGLHNDLHETPDDYADVLKALRARNLPMICANPDKRARKGETLVYCAGALAEVYEKLGGVVSMAGKPYAPIYELALKKAAELLARPVSKAEVLAIGDGPETDILGAANLGVPVVYVGGGVREQAEDMASELRHIQRLVPSAHILKAVQQLEWREAT
jgi:HAD superfamily hydrolase (TIGR01459 family)